jgi:hypothetical protein
MKHLNFLLIFFTLVIGSCKKEDSFVSKEPELLSKVKASLKDSLTANDLANLDLRRVYLSEMKDNQFMRIPFAGKKIENDFVLVQLNKDGSVAKGRIIHIEGAAQKNSVGRTEHYSFEGSIEISSLQRKVITSSAIEKGSIKAFHTAEQRSETLQPGIPVLPEVVIMCYIDAGGISFSDWCSLQSLLGNGSGSGSSAYYNCFDPSYGGGYGNVGYPVGSGQPSNGVGNEPIVYTEPVQIGYEDQYSNPAIEIQKYVNCFNAIPDAGATCSMTIFTDIPVNGDPTKFFDWSNGSPGHTFIQFQKYNGSQSVSQNIGFYPQSGWKEALTPSPVEGKLVNNEYHEFNASYQISISPAQLQTGLTRMLYLANFVQYDIDDYNCTDWALDVFNNAAGVSQRLDIPRFDIPGGMAPNGTSTPNGLYIKLQQMKQAGGSNTQGITIPLIGWAGASKGPCN